MNKLYITIVIVFLAILLTAVPAVNSKINACKHAVAQNQSSQSYSLITDTTNAPTNALACVTAVSK